MKLAIVVYSAPWSSQAALSAFKFTRAALAQGHSIYRLFFFHDGVHNANALAVAPQGEFDPVAQWRQLIAEHAIDSLVCVSSALKRGIIDAGEAHRYELDGVSLASGSAIAGLGQLVDATVHADRVINFG